MTVVQATALTESIVGMGYVGIALDRVVEQTAAVAGARQACVAVPDRGHPGWEIVAAAVGADDLIGSRVRANSALPLEAPTPALELGAGSGARLVFGGASGQLDPSVAETLATLVGAAVNDLPARRRLVPGVAAQVASLAAALDERDRYTSTHSDAVFDLVRSVAGELGLERSTFPELDLAAILHDVGKVKVPYEVLRKPSRLESHEFELISRHPAWGAEMVGRIPGLAPVAGIVRFHHERWDGLGYPDGLIGARIPLESRLIAVCDAYHAMVSDRPYRTALSHGEALTRLESGAGTQFDAEVVAAALMALERKKAVGVPQDEYQLHVV